MSFDSLLNKRCTIQTKTQVQNATGSVTLNWANAFTNVRCRYNRSSQRKGNVNAGSFQVTLEDFTFYFSFGVQITKADRILVDGKTFEVMHVYTDGSDHHLEVFAREISFD